MSFLRQTLSSFGHTCFQMHTDFIFLFVCFSCQRKSRYIVYQQDVLIFFQYGLSEIPLISAQPDLVRSLLHNLMWNIDVNNISYHIYVGIQSARGTLKCDGHAKVQWFPLKCDGVPYNEELLKCDGLTCQSAMASPLRKTR